MQFIPDFTQNTPDFTQILVYLYIFDRIKLSVDTGGKGANDMKMTNTSIEFLEGLKKQFQDDIAYFKQQLQEGLAYEDITNGKIEALEYAIKSIDLKIEFIKVAYCC